MKKFILPIIVFVGLTAAFSSCTKCYTCDFSPSRGKEKFCPKDFPDGMAGEKLTIDAYKQQGYPCVAD